MSYCSECARLQRELDAANYAAENCRAKVIAARSEGWREGVADSIEVVDEATGLVSPIDAAPEWLRLVIKRLRSLTETKGKEPP